jgi:SAM-dependent methyltransferase
MASGVGRREVPGELLMQNSTIRRACFVCGSTEGETVFETTMDVCGLGHVTYALRCCSHCGLTLQDPAVSPETMLRQYQTFSNYTAFGSGEPPLIDTARRMLAMVQAESVTPGRMYDVGASSGSMLWHFRKFGWAVAGCDPSPKACEQARERNGIEVGLGGDEETLPHRGGQDLITFSHVLEHIYDPAATLRRVHAALAEGGLLEVPCLAAPEVNSPGLFMMEHVNYFDETSLDNLLARTGFGILQAPVTVDHYPYPVITVLARKQAPQPDRPLIGGFDKNRDFCRAYGDVETRRWGAVEERLQAGIRPGEEVYVWGAGCTPRPCWSAPRWKAMRGSWRSPTAPPEARPHRRPPRRDPARRCAAQRPQGGDLQLPLRAPDRRGVGPGRHRPRHDRVAARPVRLTSRSAMARSDAPVNPEAIRRSRRWMATPRGFAMTAQYGWTPADQVSADQSPKLS